MGFSTSGATAVLLVGLLVAVGIAYPVLQGAQEARLTAIDDRDDRALDLRNSDIELEEATYDISSDDEGGDDEDENGDDEYTLMVNVTNTGSTTLSVPATDLLVDGIYQPVGEDETDVDGTAGRDLWQPGETLTFTVELDESDDPPKRVKIVTEHGIAETTTEVTDVE
ncbi:flagellin [Natronorubrum texcoconense]|uniref:Flagellar protein FlaF n=1 Tax=Natronorubrum texcoconense TaxID=1095776 RepID=A0A1G9F9Q2_9EURY|nr:flagellin [Natronorubrum texcoconense]SDK85104.1 flagellar protein FlaF [Natronorubrum texcoconense]